MLPVFEPRSLSAVGRDYQQDPARRADIEKRRIIPRELYDVPPWQRPIAYQTRSMCPDPYEGLPEEVLKILKVKNKVKNKGKIMANPLGPYQTPLHAPALLYPPRGPVPAPSDARLLNPGAVENRARLGEPIAFMHTPAERAAVERAAAERAAGAGAGAGLAALVDGVGQMALGNDRRPA